MKKHNMKKQNKTTFFSNEITGEYYKPEPFFDGNTKEVLKMIGGLAVVIIICGGIYLANV